MSAAASPELLPDFLREWAKTPTLDPVDFVDVVTKEMRRTGHVLDEVKRARWLQLAREGAKSPAARQLLIEEFFAETATWNAGAPTSADDNSDLFGWD
ncbi:MAG: hypothetical protein JO257_22765 [Deltaproteobacteria bacterium]|nr:hypothetical protein [Deltaproteobacteria bacterium]